MNCKICKRKTIEKNLCSIHSEAYKKLCNNYNSWRKALDTPWTEYLNAIAINPLTGEWVKEVASYLLENEETTNDKEV